MHGGGNPADGAGGAEMPELGPLAHDAERLDADVHADPARAPHAQLPGLQLARLQRPSLLSGHAGSAGFPSFTVNNLGIKSENLDKNCNPFSL